MSKLVKGAVLGAAVGVGAAAVEAYSKDRPVNELARNAALWGAGGMVVGAALGSLGCRRRAGQAGGEATANRGGAATATAAGTAAGKAASKAAAKAAAKAASKAADAKKQAAAKAAEAKKQAAARAAE